MLRALHLVKTGVGGSWALRQTATLVKLGVDVHVAMPPGPLANRYRAAGVTVHEADFSLPVRAPWRVRDVSRRLVDLVDRLKPDLIHSHFVSTTLTARVALGRNHGVPRLFQVPGPLHLEHPFFRTAELASAGPADYWIGSCRWTCRRYVESGVPAERVFLSYYGVDVDQISRTEDPVARTEFVNGPSAKIVGLVAYMYAPKWYLGQRRGLKGHEDLVDALQICRREIPELTGVFVGGAWNGATRYERRVTSYGRRRHPRNLFLGTRDNIPGLYRAFDVAVCPSHSENVGGAAESLLCGVPTVATDVGGLPDLVRDGQTGWLVPPRNPRALAAAILDALKDVEKARRMANVGQRLAREMFSVERTASEVAGIYRQVLARRAGARARRTA